MAAPVRIRIGAGLDASVEQAFGAYEKRAAKAAANAQRALRKGYGRRTGGAAKAAADEEIQQSRRAAKVKEKIDKNSSRAALAEIRRQSRERAREHRALLQETAREERRAARERERQQRAAARRRKQIEREAQRDIDRFATRTSHRTTRFLAPNMPLASIARRGALDLARGMGVETNFAGLMGRVVEADKMARQLSVKGFIAGAQGPAGRKQDPNVLREEARALGEDMGLATEEILRGQEAFVDLRGNLAGARDIAKDMAKLARSQGADYRDVMYMAGKAEAMFAGQAEYAGDELKKRKAINSLLRTAVYEAKKYSIPVAEMAKEFPKLAGIASQFEGDAGKNAVLLMGTAQLAEAGAAKNPATAGTYAQNLALSLTKQAGKFQSVAGVSVFSDKEKNKLKDLGTIIAQTLVATERTKVVDVRGRGRVELNQLEQLQQIIPNKRAFLGLQKYQEIFTEAGGGKAGAEAVKKTLQDLSKGIEQSQIDKDLETILGGTEAKAQKFNQQLEKVVAAMADDLVPVFEELAPTILDLTSAFGELVQWMARNPGLTIGTAIAASIARAGIESTLRAGIDTAIKQSLGGVTAGGPANANAIRALSGANGALGAFTTALSAAVVGLSAFSAAMAFLDWEESRRQKGEKEAIMTDVQTSVEIGAAAKISREKGGLSKEQYEKLKGIKEQLGSRIQEAENPAWFYQTFTQEGRNKYEQVQFDKQINNLQDLKDQMARVEQVLAQGIRVNNLNEIKLPKEGGVDPTGRE